MSLVGSITQASRADTPPATAIGPELAGPNGLVKPSREDLTTSAQGLARFTDSGG